MKDIPAIDTFGPINSITPIDLIGYYYNPLTTISINTYSHY